LEKTRGGHIRIREEERRAARGRGTKKKGEVMVLPMTAERSRNFPEGGDGREVGRSRKRKKASGDWTTGEDVNRFINWEKGPGTLRMKSNRKKMDGCARRQKRGGFCWSSSGLRGGGRDH